MKVNTSIFLGLLLSLISSNLFAQREIEYKEYPELLNLYLDEEYEEVIKECEEGGMFGKPIIKEERRQPLPYIYLAKSYYEISKIDKFKEEYSRAFKQALTYTARFVKYDEKKMFVDDHKRFLIKLRRECMDIAKMHFEKAEHERGQMRKARYFYKKMQDFSPGDPSPHYMEGLTWIKQDLGQQAERPFQAGNKKWKELESVEELEDDQQDLFKFYVREYSRYLLDEGKRDSAQSVIQKAEGYYTEDEDFMEHYNKVMQ